jgi:hypothetical protein
LSKVGTGTVRKSYDSATLVKGTTWTEGVHVPVVSGEKVLGEVPDGVEGGEVKLDEVNVVVAAQLAQLPQRWPRPLPAPEIEKN